MGFLIEYQAIKGLYLVRSRDQDKFKLIKTSRKWFYRSYERANPLNHGGPMFIRHTMISIRLLNFKQLSRFPKRSPVPN